MTDDRPTLLLLHDRGRTAEAWCDFVPLFEGRYRVLAPDLPPGAELQRAREAAGDASVAVIGHGAGGRFAQLLALEGRVEAMVLLDAPRAEEATDGDFAAFAFPVLLLWGEEDDEVPVAIAEALNDAIPSSTLGVVPGCGHDLLAEAAPTVAPLISEYLRARYLKAPHGHDHAHDGIVRIQLERRPPWVDLEEDERDDWFVEEEEEAT